MVNEVVGCRLDSSILEKIDQLINEGEFTNRGEFLKYAVRMTLKRYEGRAPPPPAINRREEEGFELINWCHYG